MKRPTGLTTTGGIARRTFLQGLGVLGIGAALSTPAQAHEDEDALTPLEPTPVYFAVYAGGGSDPQNFQYTGTPTDFRGFDPNGSLFDASTLLKSPDGNVLYYDFHFTPDNSIVGQKQPYVMVHEGDGEYTSRCQEATFEVDETPPQFAFLAPGTWRAVGQDIVKLDEKGGQLDWAVTRADFYRLNGGASEYVVSLVYLIWREGFGAPVSDPYNPQENAPDAVVDAGRTLVDGGPQAQAERLSEEEAEYVADEWLSDDEECVCEEKDEDDEREDDERKRDESMRRWRGRKRRRRLRGRLHR